MMKRADLLNKKGEVNFAIDSVEINKADEGVVTIKGYANRSAMEDGEEVKDRDGDVVVASAYDLKSFEKNSIILYQHRGDEPIGKAIAIETTSMGLQIVAEIYKDMHPAAYTGVKNGVLKTFSIGFIGKDGRYNGETDTFYYTEVELLEVSVVSIPANQESLFEVSESPCGAGGCMLSISHLSAKGFEEKPEVNHDISGKEWGNFNKADINLSLSKANDEEITRDAYLVVGDATDKSTWKFPHHEFEENVLTLSKGGVLSAYSAVKGALNDGTLGDVDALDALNHLNGHFEELVKQGFLDAVPEELVESLTKLQGEAMELEALAELVKSLQDEISAIKESQKTLESGEQKPAGEQGTEGVETELTAKEAMDFIKGLTVDGDVDELIKFYEEFGSELDARISVELEKPQEGDE